MPHIDMVFDWWTFIFALKKRWSSTETSTMLLHDMSKKYVKRSGAPLIRVPVSQDDSSFGYFVFVGTKWFYGFMHIATRNPAKRDGSFASKRLQTRSSASAACRNK